MAMSQFFTTHAPWHGNIATSGQWFNEASDMNQPTVEQLRSALEASRLPPKEHFARMVQDGLINAQGQLTKLFGGEAEPEPGAHRPDGTNSNGQH